MPASPGDGERYAQRVSRAVDDTEANLLRLVAELLRANPDSQSWEADRLREVQRLAFAAQRAGRDLSADLEQRIRDAVLDAYNAGTALSLPDLDALGIDVTPGGLPAVAVSERLAASSVAQVRVALQRMPQVLTAAYGQAVAAGAREVLGGSVTRLQASQHVLDRLLADGIGSFTDRAGRNWRLDSYVEMAVRTTTGQAAVQGHVDQLQAAGLDLVVVSDAPRECPLCRPWEGKVLSLSGRVGAVLVPSVTGGGAVRVDVAGTLEQARGAGFQHPNCRHSVNAYLPGATRLPRPRHDAAGYEAVQRQREMERRLRHWKRRKALALTDDAAAQATAKVRRWSSAIQEHTDAHDLKRLRARERVGSPGAPLAH